MTSSFSLLLVKALN